MLTKHRYDRNVRNTNKWADSTNKIPTLKTLASVDYNIVNHTDQRTASRGGAKPVTMSIFSKKTANHGKSIAEYTDFERNTAVRPNYDHAQALANDPSVFHRKDGIFTHLYNSAARLHVVKPFNY